MHRTSLKRIASGLTALAVGGAGFLAFAPPASAVVGATTAEAVTQRTVVAGDTAQAAGDLKLTVASAGLNDEIVISVDDSVAGSCSSADSYVAFNGTPTTATAGVTLTTESSAACTASTRKDVLRVKLPAITESTVITVTNVRYDLGTAVAKGPFVVTVAGDDTPANNSNATAVKVDRIQGVNRYDTAVKLAAQAFPYCPAEDTVILASGVNFPDALAANFLSGSLGQPLLLTNPTTLSTEAATAIKKYGATKVTVIGGTTAISTAVISALQAQEIATCDTGADIVDNTTKLTVTRIEGADRYHTAKLIAQASGTSVGTFDTEGATCDGALKTVILASGENFPDALAVGPLSFTGSAGGGVSCGDGTPLPLVLTGRNALNDQARDAIVGLGAQRVLILGGDVAIAPAVRTAVDNLTDVTITNIAGSTRQETAKLVAELLLNRGYDGGDVFISRGDNFPDALAGGQAAGFTKNVLVLGNAPGTTSSNVTAFLTAEKARISGAKLLGGNDAITAATELAYKNAFRARP